MFIKSLEIENYRQYTQRSFEFAKINLIKGAPDTGKSTILKAIDLLLRNYPGEGYDHFIKVNENSFRVNGSMVHKGQDIDYEVIHERGKTTKRNLNYQDKLHKNKAAVDEMARIINPVLLEYSSILPQKSKDNVLIKPKAKKLDELKRLFEISNLDIVSVNLKTEVSELDQEIKDLKKEVDTLESITFDYQDVPELADIEEVKKEHAKLEKKKQKYDELITAYNQYKEDLNKYNDAQNKIKGLSVSIKAIEDELITTQETVHIIPDFNYEEYFGIQNELDSIEQKKEQLEKDKKQYDTYIKQISLYQAKIEETEKEIDSLILIDLPKVTFTREDIKNKEEEKNNLKYEIQSLTKKIELAEKGHCPECGQDYCADVNSLKELLSQTIQKAEQVKKDINEILELSADYAAKEQANEKTLIKKESLIEKKKEYENLLSGIESVTEPENINFTRKTALLNSKLNALEKVKEEKEKAERLNKSIQEKLQSLKDQINEKKSQLGLYEKIKEPVEVIEPETFDNETYGELSRQLIIHDEQVKNRNRIIEENEKTKKKQRENQSLIEKKLKEIEDKEFNHKVKSDGRKVIDSRIIPELMAAGTSYLQEKMNEFFQRNAPEYDIKFDENMAVWFRIDDTWLPLEQFSGFREDLVRISFMRGVSSIEHSGILLMDEGEAAADVELSTKLFDIILDDPELEQIFAITHKTETVDYLVNNYGANLIEVGK